MISDHTPGIHHQAGGGGGGAEEQQKWRTQKRMAEMDPNANTCIRGCCTSTTIPLHLPSHTLLYPIAKGAESTVHAALLPNNRRVAAKKPFLPTSDHLDKFHRELQILCELDHPGVGRLVAAHAWPPNYLLFFEIYEEGSLAEKLHVDEWSPGIEEALAMMTRIAEALLYVHNLGILHRDVKPANILLDHNLLPYIADFGLAIYKKDLRTNSANNWRSSGKPTGGFHKKNMVGTLIYMAPEILSKEMHTEKSDVYSFAVMMNELLTGVVPYTDLRAEAQAHTVLEMNYTEQQLSAAVVAEGLRPMLASSESGVPPRLLSLIERSWDPDPVRRPSMAGVVEDLKSIMISVKESCQMQTVNRFISFTSSDEFHTTDQKIERHSAVDNVQKCQEDLNWFNQGEHLSNANRTTSPKGGMWLESLHDHPIYQPKLSWGSFATCGRRETMEDTHFLLPEFCKEIDVHLFGILDGHRGAAAAEFSARALPGFLQMLCSTTGPAQALVEAFIRTDIAFRKELVSQYNAKRITHKDWHPGCTAVAALMVRDMLFVANAGDCRTILCRSGHPFPLTNDHLASCPAERARVTKEGVEVKWQIDTWRVGAAALQVTRSIGDDDLKPAVTAEPESTETLLSAEDEYMVMASDGLWDVVSNEDVISIIRDTVKEPGMCSKRLATEAVARGGKDNITVIVVFLRPVSTVERIY